MNIPAIDLSALVSARLCHDLVSPLGAIGNGLELMEMSTTGRTTSEFALVADSLTNAIGKLKFLRIAFGPAESSARLSFEEVSNITTAAFPGRYSVTWTNGGGSMPRTFAKAACLALLCLERSLPLGGEVQVAVGEDHVDISVEGRRIAPPAELWAHVTEGSTTEPMTSDVVQFMLLRAWLDAVGGQITTDFLDSGAKLRLSLPIPEPA